jgi:hypothetical protein
MSRYTHCAPFRTSQNDRLYAFRFDWTRRSTSSITVFALLSTFMAHIDSLRAGKRKRSFSWEDWGERGARVLEFGTNALDIRSVHGMKFCVVNNNQIEVYDFNQLSFRRGVQPGMPPLSIVINSVFMQPVYSSLPYQVYSAPLPNSWPNSWPPRLHISIAEDCLMPVVEWRVSFLRRNRPATNARFPLA